MLMNVRVMTGGINNKTHTCHVVCVESCRALRGSSVNHKVCLP